MMFSRESGEHDQGSGPKSERWGAQPCQGGGEGWLMRQSAVLGGVESPGGWCPQSASEYLKGWSFSQESTAGLVLERAASAVGLAQCARA